MFPRFGPPLAEFYDDQICALSTRPNARTEASFLASYRSHVLDQHGKLEPPDFDRRRRVPISDIYVPPVIYEDIHPERTVVSAQENPPTLTVWDLAHSFVTLARNPDNPAVTAVMSAVGQHLTRYPDLPWVTGKADRWYWADHSRLRAGEIPASVTPVAFLGAAAIALMTAEPELAKTVSDLQGEPSQGLGPFSVLYAYMTRRNVPGSRTPLPDLPVPEEFRQVFRDWAEGKVNFIAPAPE